MSGRLVPWLAALQLGCATPAVHERWKAYDAVEQVEFSAERAGQNEAVLHWRVLSDQLAPRTGQSEVTIHSPTCEQLEFQIDGREIGAPTEREWLGLRLDPDESEDEAPPRTGRLPDCTIEVRPNRWSGRSSPTFELLHRSRSMGTLETKPPRRIRWIPVYPFAVATDAVLATPWAIAYVAKRMISRLDDFTWTRKDGINWHRERSERRREEEERRERFRPARGPR